eukprot:snap_masked-scaffold_1-processed-gene-25.50-mRNA-1 protein AED:1.00 eAED:1.00 QI:0/-1/0/0/-1/1/1/0/231
MKGIKEETIDVEDARQIMNTFRAHTTAGHLIRKLYMGKYETKVKYPVLKQRNAAELRKLKGERMPWRAGVQLKENYKMKRNGPVKVKVPHFLRKQNPVFSIDNISKKKNKSSVEEENKSCNKAQSTKIYLKPGMDREAEKQMLCRKRFLEGYGSSETKLTERNLAAPSTEEKKKLMEEEKDVTEKLDQLKARLKLTKATKLNKRIIGSLKVRLREYEEELRDVRYLLSQYI